jgi:imidazolonepropionase-like amidohydrolase
VKILLADRVWDGTAAVAIERGFVAVEGTAITNVGRQVDLGSAVDTADVVDLGGCTVLPGLINAHVHLTFSASAAPVADYVADAEAGLGALTLRAVQNVESAARVGVTTVRDLGTLNEVAFAVRDAAAKGTIDSPRILTSGNPITVTGGHCHWFSHHCDTEDEVRQAVHTQVSSGADLVKIFATGGNMTPGTDPFAPQYTQAELDACVQECHRLGVPVAAHAHATEGIRRAVAARVTTVEHCSFETPDGVEYDPAIAEAMAASGIAFCPTLGVSLYRASLRPPEERNPIVTRLLARHELVVAAFRGLLAAGVSLLAGSDAGIPLRPFSDYPEDVATLVHDNLGLTALDALRAATSQAAALLGLGDTGVLAPGRRADLLAVEGNPLIDIDELRRTRLVMIAGRTVRR